MASENREYKIDHENAINILDRIIGFINNCDSKASIRLGVVGVVMALMFTADGIIEIKRIISLILSNPNFCDLFFFGLWIASMLVLCFGLYKFISVLTAKIDCNDRKQTKLDLNSKIFFGTIASQSYNEYEKKLIGLNEKDYLNDIISQIYINSIICNNKFKKYNMGLRFSLIGFITFIVLWGIGSYLY